MAYIINCGCRSHAENSNRTKWRSINGTRAPERIGLLCATCKRIYANSAYWQIELNILRDKCCTNTVRTDPPAFYSFDFAFTVGAFHMRTDRSIRLLESGVNGRFFDRTLHICKLKDITRPCCGIECEEICI